MDYRKAKGVARLRTMHSTKQRSIPRVQRSSAIELFLLEKERERFIKEAERLQDRLLTVYERIEVLSAEIGEQRQIQAQKQTSHTQGLAHIGQVKAALMQSKASTITASNSEGNQWNTKKLMY